jgi:DNA repair protein RadC
LANAAAFILAHNHPSGDPSPSAEDHAITTRLKQCGELFGLGLLDHVVLGHERYFSMADQGVL